MSLLTARKPDFTQFLKVLRRQGRPTYLPFYEHIAATGFIAVRTGTKFDQMKRTDPGHWEIYVDFWLGLGFDCIPMEIPLNCPLPDAHTALTDGSEAFVVIKSMEDFEKFPWPDEASPIDFSHFEKVASLIPEGVKIVGGVEAGPFEWTSKMMGTMGLSMAILADPDLVQAVTDKIGSLHASAHRQLATWDVIGALRQGDDLGFKTSTFLSPPHLRQYIFPIYKKLTAAAHDQNKPFILHSCGNLREVYDDLIDDCKIDAKHSYEDVILPVQEFKKQYGRRVTAIGGLDVDVICRSSIDDVKKYARKMIEACFADGYWALGTGNSLTDYMPVENYLAVLEEGLKITG